MNKFLETYDLPRLNHDEIENLNTSITSIEIESVIKIIPTNESQGPGGFIDELCQTFKEYFNVNSVKLSHTHIMRPALP